MATKRTPGSRPGLVRCDHCGEEYSESYRRCPFCADYDADVEYETRRLHTTSGQTATAQRTAPSRTASSRSSASRGGKRVAQSNRRGGGYTKISAGKIIFWLLSLIFIIAAIWILVTQVGPMFGSKDNKDPNDVDPNTSHSAPVDENPDVSDPTPDASPDVDVSPSPVVPSGDTAAGFTLNLKDFSFTDRYPEPITLKATFSPAGTTAAITWTSNNPNIASVDANGTVTYGAVRGTATITAAMANGVKQTCTVYNQMTSGSAYQPSPEPSTTQSSYSLNKTDFTFFAIGESTKLQVKNYTGTITWSSSNTSVASVSIDGTVKPAGTGKASCTITATLDDGTKLQAIARISI